MTISNKLSVSVSSRACDKWQSDDYYISYVIHSLLCWDGMALSLLSFLSQFFPKREMAAEKQRGRILVWEGPPPPPLPDSNFADFLLQRMATHGDGAAMVSQSWGSLYIETGGTAKTEYIQWKEGLVENSKEVAHVQGAAKKNPLGIAWYTLLQSVPHCEVYFISFISLTLPSLSQSDHGSDEIYSNWPRLEK